jgi:hypothetical protein
LKNVAAGLRLEISPLAAAPCVLSSRLDGGGGRRDRSRRKDRSRRASSLFSMCSQLINASRLPTRHLPPRIASQLRLCVVVLPCGANHITVARITPCSLATISHSMSPPLLGSYYLYLEPTLSASDPLPAGLPSSYSILFPHKSYVSNFSF